MGSNAVALRTWILFELACVLALALRPVLAGWPVLHALGSTLFLVGCVWLPGRAVLAWMRTEQSALEQAFLAWIVGYACLTAVFVPLCMLDLRSAIGCLPALALIALLAARKRSGKIAPSLPQTSDLIALALVFLFVLVRIQPEAPERWFLGFGRDDSFHVENAAELRWRWPMQDPRLAGEPLRYHFFAYASPAAMSVMLGLSVRESLLGLTPHVWPMLFALGVFSVARALGARTLVAAAATLALVLHADLGAEVLRWWQVDLSFPAPFQYGLYMSSTTAFGLCCLLALILLHARLLDRERPLLCNAILLAFIALLASGAKGSILPPLVAGALGILGWHWLRRRAFPARDGLAAVLLLLASLPMTLWLAGGDQNYAQAMFRWSPGWVQRTGAFQSRIVEWLGFAPLQEGAWVTAALLPLWTIGFLGAAGAGLALWAFARRASRVAIEGLLALTVLAGLLPAWLLAAPGLSQLFFGYVSQVTCALLGVLGAERLLLSKSRVAHGALVAAAALLCVHVVATLAALPTLIQRAPVARLGGNLWNEYRSSLEWIRTNLPADAVLLVDEVRLCVGPCAERRMFYEHATFSPLTHASFQPYRPRRETRFPEAYLARKTAQKSFFQDPDPATLVRIREQLDTKAPLFVLRSAVSIGMNTSEGGTKVEISELADPQAWGASVGAELVHRSAPVAIYRLPPARDPQPGRLSK